MNYCCIMWVLFLLLIKNSLGSSLVITDNIFANTPSLTTGRSLLQIKTDCSVNFEVLNYTPITSQCKVPYPPVPCCSAFKVFACPYASLLNDESNNCAERMFSSINLLDHYPPGLFNSLCREGKDGLSCPAPPPSPSSVNDNANGLQTQSAPCLLQIFTAGLMLIFFWIF